MDNSRNEFISLRTEDYNITFSNLSNISISAKFTVENEQISSYICSYNVLNEHLIKRLSKKIGTSVAKPVWR